MIVQLMKKPPAMQEILVPFLGWEDLREKEMATHPGTQAWKLQSMGWRRVVDD